MRIAHRICPMRTVAGWLAAGLAAVSFLRVVGAGSAEQAAPRSPAPPQQLTQTDAAKPPPSARPTPTPAMTLEAQRALLDQYCAGCHNDRLKTAGLSLTSAPVDAVPEHAATWEKVIRKLRAGTMPPDGRPQPG